MLRSPLDALSCALLPACCTLCGSSLPRLALVPVCELCWTEFSVHTTPSCARCGDLLHTPDAPIGSNLCRTCRMAPPPFERAVSYGPYRGRMRAAIHALKYGRMRPAAHKLGEMLAEAIAPLANLAPAELLVVPVPLHRSRQHQRGFNQSQALAVSALQVLRRTHPDWMLQMAPRSLMRLRPTPVQAGLTARQRRINMRRAFRVADSGAVAGRSILLIDDVLTTGATVRAAAQELLRAGADSVWVATLARAGRIFPVHRGSDLFFDEPERPSAGAPQEAPVSFLQPTRFDSLHGQSSF